MKNKSIYSLGLVAMLSCLSACDSEKDLVIIDGDLPIKTNTLFMVGDATPNGWSIDSPTPLNATDEDPLVFTWEGQMNKGELKLCLTPGSWDAPFIRPLNDGDEIGTSPISDVKFQMHAGDPDEKWHIIEPGAYKLTFDLRNWTMSSVYLKGADAPSKEPIQTETLYIVGDATPAGWNIDAPTLLTKTSDYIFEYDGQLNEGELKACTTTGDWNVPFIRPESAEVQINKDGVGNNNFVYVANPDDKWKVTDSGIYHLTFDLQNYTITAEYKDEVVTEKNPIETETLYMIGDATPGGWSMDDATPLSVSDEDEYVFTWTGQLNEGEMKLCLEPDGTFSCPFIRPTFNGCVINESGVESPEFEYSTDPDDKWKVQKAGTYNLTFNLKSWTFEATYLD